MADFEIREVSQPKRRRARFTAAVDPQDTTACLRLLEDEVAARRLGDAGQFALRTWVGRRRRQVEYRG